MERRSSHGANKKKKKKGAGEPYEYLPLSKVIPLITLGTFNTVSVATSVAAR